ncbi:unnamed protein product, partial [Ectocarpus sp. 12 AP-2014]
MNDIVIDATTGDVAVKAMIKHIMPDLNENGILKSVHRVLEGYDGPKLSTRLINGRLMSVATLGLCYDILEKMSGPKWRTWRLESAQTFKKALRERVEQRAEQVTRASMLQNALRSINIHVSIRIDEDSVKASIIDTVRVICPNVSPENAAHILTRFLEKENGDGTPSHVLGVQGPTPIAERIDYIKINGKGNTTPVCDSKTLVEIIWLLPSRAAKEFRRQSAHTITRVLGGDTSLCDEIEQRCDRLQSTDEGKAYQSFLLDQGPANKQRAVETFDGMPAGFKCLSEEDRTQFAKQMFEHKLEESRAALKRKRIGDLVQSYRELKDLGVHLDGRTLIELRDNVTILSRQDVVVNNAVAVATPLLQDSSTPTHELTAEHRGKETGIVIVSNKIGVKVPQAMSGVVGKLMKKLYIKKYDLAADFRGFIKRQTLFSGRPVDENTYYERDEDIIEEAIREVM